MPFATLVSLVGITVGDYAARGLTVELVPIDSGPLQYDINGTLHDLTLTQFRKYAVTLSCTDQESPNFDNIWKGKTVTITLLPQKQIGLTAQDTVDGPLVLDCLISEWSVQVNEWGHQTGWSIKLLQA